MTTMGEEKKWKFAQCFGDKGDSDDITEGTTKGTKRERKLMMIISGYNISGGI